MLPVNKVSVDQVQFSKKEVTNENIDIIITDIQDNQVNRQ
jgi:hypothetical protein